MKRGFLKATLQMVVMFALMYSCLYLIVQAIEADTRDELLTREQKAEVMSRQYSDLEREERISTWPTGYLRRGLSGSGGRNSD